MPNHPGLFLVLYGVVVGVLVGCGEVLVVGVVGGALVGGVVAVWVAGGVVGGDLWVGVGFTVLTGCVLTTGLADVVGCVITTLGVGVGCWLARREGVALDDLLGGAVLLTIPLGWLAI